MVFIFPSPSSYCCVENTFVFPPGYLHPGVPASKQTQPPPPLFQFFIGESVSKNIFLRTGGKKLRRLRYDHTRKLSHLTRACTSATGPLLDRGKYKTTRSLRSWWRCCSQSTGHAQKIRACPYNDRATYLGHASVLSLLKVPEIHETVHVPIHRRRRQVLKKGEAQAQ